MKQVFHIGLLRNFVDVIKEISGLLHGPFSSRVLSDINNFQSPCAEVDKDKYVIGEESAFSPNLMSEKVTAPHDMSVCFNKLLPC